MRLFVTIAMWIRPRLRVFKRATHLSARNVKERGEGFFVNLIDKEVSACMQLFLPHTYAQLFALLRTVSAE